MTSKWPLNDLKWPIRTWKHNFLTKSHFGACYMSFHRFLWMPSRLRLSDLSFESPNDLRMTSSNQQWPQNKTFSPNLTLGHAICLYLVFLVRWIDCAHKIWVLSHQMTSKWLLNDLKWPIWTWKHNFFTKSHSGDSKLKSHKRNRLGAQKKTYEKTCYMPQSEIW